MSRLLVNIKLALPGLAVMSNGLFFDCFNIDELFTYAPDTIKALRRMNFDITPLQQVLETGSDESAELFKKLCNEVAKSLSTDVTATPAIIELVKHIGAAAVGNEKHYNSLRDKIGMLNKPEITALFPIAVDTQYQSLHIETATQYSAEELKQFRESKDPKYAEVVRAKRLSRDIVSDFIRTYCRARGQRVSYAGLLAALNEAKLKHGYPTGFVGKIDEFGVLYTVYDKRVDGVPLNCIVQMNPEYTAADSCHIFKAKSEVARNYTYFYTIDYRQNAKAAKFNAVKQLAASIDDIRSKWIKCLSVKHKSFEAAAILEIIYQTQARIGSTSNATLDKRSGKYKKTFGISTILGTHISEVGYDLHIRYPGKAAFKGDIVHYQTHILVPGDANTQTVVKWLRQHIGSEKPVFSATAQDVRDLMKDLGAPEGTSVHKLRTLKGTLMMKERIKKHPFATTKTSATAVTRWLKEQALDVGIQLGHMSGEKYTASTAIGHYIDPITMLKLYRDAKVVPPATMLKLVGISKNSLETL